MKLLRNTILAVAVATLFAVPFLWRLFNNYIGCCEVK